MKRFLCILLLLSMLAGLIGCGTKDTGDDPYGENGIETPPVMLMR